MVESWVVVVIIHRELGCEITRSRVYKDYSIGGSRNSSKSHCGEAKLAGRTGFRLSTLMVFIAFLAVFMAALTQSTHAWKRFTTSATFSVFLVALVLAMNLRRRERLFWSGFVVLGVCHWVAVTRGLPWLGIVGTNGLPTVDWIPPIRDYLHPRPTTQFSSLSSLPVEWKHFHPIGQQFTSLLVAWLGAQSIVFLAGHRVDG